MLKISKPNIYQLISAALILIILVQLARLFWVIATPVGPVGRWKPVVPQMMDFANRTALFDRFDPFFKRTQNSEEEGKVTALPLTLFGIRGNAGTGAGSAIIADSAGVQNSYLVGQEIMPGVKLHKVAFDHIILDNNGSLELLYLDQSSSAEIVEAAPAATIDEGAGSDNRGQLQINAQTFASSINLQPRKTNAGVTGLVVSAKDDGAMLRSAGLQSGDIVTKINGKSVTSANDIITQVRPGARLSLEVERGANVVPIAIILENQ
ncbi:type II secretion system protein N [Sphingorhabdus lutea]|uniref:type II secretion system protein N n=1 Tax=Sphingorhabdus lutea TaxID=1913578 RepID=UPI0018DB84D3|nr:type II secretion system protein N [Sphingorhabdus lutea]